MKRLEILLAACMLPLSITAQPAVERDGFEGYTIAEEGAWCWFADPRAIHHRTDDGLTDKSYIGYIDTHGTVKAMQIDWKAGSKEEVLIRSYFQPDDHDNPTFLILPDERVMVFYSRHTDEPCFYYRVSREKGDITTLGEERKLMTRDNTTYPSPFILSDDPEHIYLCWRGINWHPTIGRLDMPDEEGRTGFAEEPRQIVQSTGARPYAKYFSNGKDRIYVTYTTGHPDNEYPNSVYCNAIDINTMNLEDISGDWLGCIKDGPHQVNAGKDYLRSHPAAVVDHADSRDWIWQMTLDESGHPVIAMVRISEDKKSHDYYRAEWTGKTWKKTFLAHAGGHFHQTAETEHCYSGGMAIDHSDSRCIYASVPVEGKYGRVYEIVRFNIGINGSVSKTPVTSDSRKNNVRPYSIPGPDNDLSLIWMNGDYYDWIVSSMRPLGFSTSIRSIIPLPEDADLSGITLLDAEVDLSGLKDGQSDRSLIWDFDDFSYGINRTALKPYLIINDRICRSQNIVGNSDGWKSYRRATDGKWLDPAIPDSIHLRITYSGGIVKTYINGLLDQRVRVNQAKNLF